MLSPARGNSKNLLKSSRPILKYYTCSYQARRKSQAIAFTLQFNDNYYDLPFVNQRYFVFAYCLFPQSPPPENIYKYNYDIIPGITDVSMPTGDIKILFRLRCSSMLTVDQQLASIVKWKAPTRFGKSLCFNKFKDSSILEVI